MFTPNVRKKENFEDTKEVSCSLLNFALFGERMTSR